MLSDVISLGEEVAAALGADRPVVALESTLIAHGLPRPGNAATARELEAAVRAGGATPATVAVLDGRARIGLDAVELDRVASDTALRKLGARDLPIALASGASGATTVSATSVLAAMAGIRVFATGGLGGVHRRFVETWDESADLEVLSSTRITVVCAGVKSVLDVRATVERLETLGVAVIGYRTRELPGFYLHSSGLPLDWSVDDPEAVSEIMDRQECLGLPGALVVANPLPLDQQLDPVLHDAAIRDALQAAERDGVSGQALTPFLLDQLVARTGGRSLDANVAAVRGNVGLAAAVAVSWAASRAGVRPPAPGGRG